MTREEKITAIYKEMANKDLSFGCKVKFSKWIYTIINKESVWSLNSYVTENWAIHNTIVIEDRVNSRCYLIEEIIWHPVMIGTIFERYSSSRWFIHSQFVMELIEKWTWYDRPIDDQTDECIDYVYSLIQKN